MEQEQMQFFAIVTRIRDRIEALQLSLGVPDQGPESNIQEDIDSVEAAIENLNTISANSRYIHHISNLRRMLDETRSSYLVAESRWWHKHENIEGETVGQNGFAEAVLPAVQLHAFAVRNLNMLLVIQTDTLVVQDHNT
jgi:hypothetical protein